MARAMITDPDVYFAKGCGRCDRFDTPDCSTMRWNAGLTRLRAICADLGLMKTAKWGHPVYMHAGRNLVIIGAFRDDYRLSFFNAGLMKDPEGILQKKGANTQTADMISFNSNAQPAEMEDVIRDYLSEAMGYAKAGIKAEKTQIDIVLPDELIAALDDDPELAEAFEALTPGRQRSYVINLNGAKQSATRVTRIARFRDKIIAGKGALER
ncbi:YdeI family protein [Octadecabacter sp. R77987]|uniref:YdeI/OmpD-associated family protein n=1 Tax=Octadecabacter sp. R77987 TaxID=3093874 RepID=UPI0036729702